MVQKRHVTNRGIQLTFSKFIIFPFFTFTCSFYLIHLAQCVRACDSSCCLSFGQINCISCQQWVSCHCGKVWDISDDLNSCKKTYTDYMERGFHQNATAYFFLRLSAWQHKRRRGTVVGSKVTPEGINFFQVKVKVDLAPFVFFAVCSM